MNRAELISAAMDEIEQAMASNGHLLETGGCRTLNVRLTTTKIVGGVRIAGSCVSNGQKHFSFGTIVTDHPEEL